MQACPGFQDFADGLAQLRDLPAAGGAVALCGQVLNGFAGKMFRKRPTRSAGVALGHRRFAPFGASGLEFFERELELTEHLIHFLGAATKLHAPQLGDHELQVGDLGGLLSHPRT